MPTTVFGSMPALSKAAFLGARRFGRVPDEVKDDDALAQGIVTPQMLELIMSIVQELMQNCLDNNATMAWRRIQGYVNTNKPLDRMGDQIRLNWIINRWLGNLGYPRDRGDVVMFREAITQAGASLKEEEFRALQTEILFLTI